MGLAEALLRREQGRPERVNEWVFAAKAMSTALSCVGRAAEAEVLCRDTLATVDGMGLRTRGVLLIQLRETLGTIPHPSPVQLYKQRSM